MTLRIKLLVGALLPALLLAACAPANLPVGGEPTPETTTSPNKEPLVQETVDTTGLPARTPSPEPLGGQEAVAGDLPEAVQAAVSELSDALNLATGKVQVVSYEETTWRDSCLGLAGPEEMCLQVLTPGYLVILEAGGQRYEVHTDATGKNIREKAGALGGRPGLEQGAVVIAAVRALSESLGVPVDDIDVASVEKVEWPNACLGLAQPGEMCAEVITPGYLIILNAAGQEYELHTDLTGDIVRQQ